MKKLLPSILVGVLSILYSSAFSQWTTDPAAPTTVCNAISDQVKVITTDDGAGGMYTFWRDSRAGSTLNAVYGQRYDANGIAQWESNGRMVLSYFDNIASFNVLRSSSDGEMIIGAVTGPQSGDTLRFQSLDANGAHLWQNDVIAATKIDGGFIYIDGFSMLRDGSGYCAKIEVSYMGGSNGNRITRFNSQGVLTGVYNGVPVGTQTYFGHSQILRTYDANDDVYLWYTNGNGAGAHATLYKIDVNANVLFGPIDVMAGTNGLSYQTEAISDANGITFLWQENSPITNSVDLTISRFLNNGTAAWSPSAKSLCNADGAQGQFFWKKNGAYLYIVWADGRPGVVGNYATYAQKLNMLGDPQWQVNGVLVADDPTYIPYPKFDFDENGNMIIAHLAGGTSAFNAQKVDPNGNLLWPSTGTKVSNTNYTTYLYDDFQVMHLSSGTNVAVWSGNMGGTAGDLFMNKIQYVAPITNISENPVACDSYTTHGQTYTSSGTYIQELPGDTVLTVNLILNHSSSYEYSDHVCDAEYVLNGQHYTTSGDFTQLLVNEAGCDSTLMLHLTIGYANQGTLSASICDGDFYTVNGETYSAAGTYTQHLTNNSGCDSTLTLLLDVVTLDTTYHSVNNFDIFEANQSDANYQWINCSTQQVIGTNSTVTIFENGYYQLVVSANGCSAETECDLIIISSVPSIELSKVIDIYPNPGRDQLNLMNELGFNNASITIESLDGKVVDRLQGFSGKNIQYSTSNWSNGIYMIEIVQSGSAAHFKWIKE
jgi:Secretion system C-terminal sorting domain